MSDVFTPEQEIEIARIVARITRDMLLKAAMDTDILEESWKDQTVEFDNNQSTDG